MWNCWSRSLHWQLFESFTHTQINTHWPTFFYLACKMTTSSQVINAIISLELTGYDMSNCHLIRFLLLICHPIFNFTMVCLNGDSSYSNLSPFTKEKTAYNPPPLQCWTRVSRILLTCMTTLYRRAGGGERKLVERHINTISFEKKLAFPYWCHKLWGLQHKDFCPEL